MKNKNNTAIALCTKHPTKVQTYQGTNDELVAEFININYLGLAEFTHSLSKDILYQSIADKERKRYKLSKELYRTAVSLKIASENLLDLHYLYIQSGNLDYRNKSAGILSYSNSYDALAKDVGNLRYKESVEILSGIEKLVKHKFESSTDNYLVKLAAVANNFYQAKNRLNNAWIVSKPYML